MYHAGVGESEEDLVLKRHLDRLYSAFPFFGSPKMIVELAKLGLRVCRKREWLESVVRWNFLACLARIRFSRMILATVFTLVLKS